MAETRADRLGSGTEGYSDAMNAVFERAEMPRPDPGTVRMPTQPAPGEPGLPENPIIDPPTNPT